MTPMARMEPLSVHSATFMGDSMAICSNPIMAWPPVAMKKTEMAATIQKKPSSAHATTQATSTATLRTDEIDPRPVALINMKTGAPLQLDRECGQYSAIPGLVVPRRGLPCASLSGGMDSDHIEKQ